MITDPEWLSEKRGATFRSHAQRILHELGEYIGYSPLPLLERMIEDAQKTHQMTDSTRGIDWRRCRIGGYSPSTATAVPSLSETCSLPTARQNRRSAQIGLPIDAL